MHAIGQARRLIPSIVSLPRWQKRGFVKHTWLALLAAALLGACGDDTPTENDTSKPDTPPAETPPAETPPTEIPPAARSAPVSQGELAPTFAALPKGKAVVVFYRGHW